MKKKSQTAALLMAMIFMFAGQHAKAKAADAARISGSADVCIIQADASYSSGAAATATFTSKKVNMDGTLDRPGAWAYYTIDVQNQGDASAMLSKVELCDETPEYITVTSGIKDEHVGDILMPGEKRKVGILVQWNPADETALVQAKGGYCLTLAFDGASDIPDTSDGSGLPWLSRGLAGIALAAGILYRRSRKTN